MPEDTKPAPAPEPAKPTVDAAALAAELETYRASVSKAEQAARLRAIESRIPSHVPEGARKLIARGVLAQLGAFAIDLETLDAKTPQQIIDAIGGAGLDALRPQIAAAAAPAPAAAAPAPAAAAPAPAAAAPAPAAAAPTPIVPPTPSAAPAARQPAGRIAGALYPQEQKNPVADALAALVARG